MAKSTFDRFRQHTKWLMVVLGAMLMFAFVVADPLMQMAGGRGGSGYVGGDEVAVSWEGGELTNEQVADLVQRRQVLARFLDDVLVQGGRAAVEEGNPNPVPLVQPLRLPSTAEQGVEQDVVLTKIYADAARDAGMTVGDETVRTYLEDLGFRKVSRSQMRELLSNMGGRFTIDYIFDLLRDALLARNYVQSYAYTELTVLPQQRWRDWLRVNDEIIVEAAALRASDFVSEVKDPSEEELRAYYDEHKDSVGGPVRLGGVELPSPTPGFTTPRRVVIEYAKLSMDNEVERLIDTVTEEEIEKFYNENKELFVREESMFDLDDAGLEDADPEEAEGEDAGAELEDGEAEDESADGEAAEESASADEETGDDTEESAGEAVSEAAESSDEATAGEETDSEQPADSGPQSSAEARKTPFRLAAYQDEAASPAEEEAAGATPEASDSQPAESNSAGDELFGPADEAEAAPADEEADASDAEETTETDEEKEKPVEYQTLDEVRDDIRLRLAEAKVSQQLAERMESIAAPLTSLFDDFDIELIDLTDGIDPEGEDAEAAKEKIADIREELFKKEKYQPLKQLEAFAKENGLEFAKTADLSLIEFRETAIGGTRDLTRTTGNGLPMPLLGRVFGDPSIELFEPILTYDVIFDRNRQAFPTDGYLVVKTVDKPRKTPTFDEARPDVLRAWKLDKAADLALKRAEEIATEASAEGFALKDFLAGQASIKVAETDAFAWFSQGQPNPTSMMIPLRLSQPEPIEAPGPKFMEKVFSLGPNEQGAVLNFDRSVAYAVRVVQHMASRSELKNEFLVLGTFQHQRYGFMDGYRRATAAARLQDLLGVDEEGELSLDWKRTPDELN